MPNTNILKDIKNMSVEDLKKIRQELSEDIKNNMDLLKLETYRSDLTNNYRLIGICLDCIHYDINNKRCNKLNRNGITFQIKCEHYQRP